MRETSTEPAAAQSDSEEAELLEEEAKAPNRKQKKQSGRRWPEEADILLEEDGQEGSYPEENGQEPLASRKKKAGR